MKGSPQREEISMTLASAIEQITGKKAEFIQWNGTGPAQRRGNVCG
ncbi:hypothetical protein X744_06040 [Mesorhizobium sp. LNJC372A00]|nr:hypothetical protein X744_06040 [Mesorhizobium sp. LNJC372A00]